MRNRWEDDIIQIVVGNISHMKFSGEDIAM